MHKDFSLTSRVEQFGLILQRCSVTREDGASINIEVALAEVCATLNAARQAKHNIYLIGNGGSASIAAHATTDFFNVAKLRASTLHESSLLTCMANDFGYENAFANMISQSTKPDDILIAISSSGQSANILNAVAAAKANDCNVITLSGFSENNPLNSLGHLNFWLDSHDYGFVEIGHQFLLHNIADRLGAELKA